MNLWTQVGTNLIKKYKKMKENLCLLNDTENNNIKKFSPGYELTD